MRSNIICKVLLFFGLVAGLQHCSHPTSSDGQESMVLLYVSDLHSQLRADSMGRGGYAQLASWIESEKSKAGPKTDVIVLGGGDLLGKGSIPCQVTQDKECIPLLRDFSLDYATLGNYELYQSPADLDQMIKNSGALWLSSNVGLVRDPKKPAVSVSWTQGPLRIVGKNSALSFWLYSWTGPFDVKKEYQVRKFPAPSDWSALKQLSMGEPILFMTHMEAKDDFSFLRDACLEMTKSNQIVALMKANDHRVMHSDLSQCAPILEPGPFGQYALRMVLKPVKGQKAFQVHSEFVEIKGFPEDAKVAKKVSALYSAHAPDADKILLTLEKDLSREALAQWVADSFRIRTRADVAIMNVGYVKHGLPAGAIRQEDFFLALPYANELQGTDWPVKNLEKSLCDVSRTTKDSNLDWGSELYYSGMELQNPGTAQCKIVGLKKSSVKVVVDSYLVSRSARWLGRDLTKQVFRFGVDSRRVGLLHLKDNPPQ